MKTARQLIRESYQTDSTVHVDLQDLWGGTVELIAECDDSAVNGSIEEYWGEGWRIHVHTYLERTL